MASRQDKHINIDILTRYMPGRAKNIVDRIVRVVTAAICLFMAWQGIKLIRLDLEDLVIERMVIELLNNAANIREVRIINCHKRGNIEKALNGKNIGTVIRAE